MSGESDPQWSDFDLWQFFQGHLKAWGLFEDRFGMMRRRFVVDLEGRVEQERLYLYESFRFDDAAHEQRIWKIAKQDAGRYQGLADDIPGTARGFESGCQLRWRYPLQLVSNRLNLRVDVDDRIYRMPDDTAFSRGYVSKWGMRIGTISLFFQKIPGSD